MSELTPDKRSKKPVRYASRWVINIDQRDEDGFHGTEEWLGGTNVYPELREAVEAAKKSMYEDSAGANTHKIVITAYREKR